MRGKCNVGIKINMRRNAMFNFLKKMRIKDNTPKKGYDLSYDNLAIPEIHIKGNADAKPGGSDNKVNGQQAEGADGAGDVNAQNVRAGTAGNEDMAADNADYHAHMHKKTHVTYDGVAVPEIHFKEND